MQQVDFCVIGNGLLGSAAFRWICESNSGSTLLIGSAEQDAGTVYAAHYDESRLTHLHSKNALWGELCHRSITRYRELEAASGIPFYDPVGELFVKNESTVSNNHNIEHIRYSQSRGADMQTFTPESNPFPFLSFPPGSELLFERSPAGQINPRKMLRAQVTLGEKLGGRAVSDVVSSCQQQPGGGLLVTCRSGATVLAGRVLVATGSWANMFDVLPRKLALQAKTESVLLARVSAEEAARLHAMPVVHYDLQDELLSNIYMVRPTRHPDGHHYLKIGANTVYDRFLDTLEQQQRWYREGSCPLAEVALSRALLRLFPRLQVLSWHSARCLITRTPSGMPMIDAVQGTGGGDSMYCAVGGNGSSACCADALGQLAARMVVAGGWQRDPVFQASMFQAVYQEQRAKL